MSQKRCSLALDEVKIEEQDELERNPELNLLVKKTYLKNKSSFLHMITPQEDAVKVKGRIIVSF